jgi:cobalt-zinc-cadmium efflux system outer membrane protein
MNARQRILRVGSTRAADSIFMRHRAALLSLILCASAAPKVAAQPSASPALPAEVGWSEVRELVRTRSPQLAAIRAHVDVARRDVAVAGVLPNPSLDYLGYKRVGSGEQYNTQHQIGLGLPLWLAGQRGARVRAAERNVEVARAEASVDQRELEASALRAFVALLAAQERVHVIERAQADIAEVAHIVHERVSAGAQSEYDAARVDLETAQLATSHAGAIADAEAASASFAQLLGEPTWRPRATGTLSPLAVDADFNALWKRAEHSLPELTAAERKSAAASSEIDVARAERWPVPTLSLGTLLTTDARSTSLYGGISLPLPIFDFGGAAIDRGNAALAAANAERNASIAATRANLAGAISALTARRATLAGYEHDVATRLPQLRGMAEAAYKSGQATVLELLDSMRSSIEVSLQHVELTHDVLDSELDTLAAAGLLDSAS